jgi:hypothetical protein
MPGPNVPYSQLDFNQVIVQSFDESKDRLRVDAQVSATISDIEIKDPVSGYSLKINSDGSINTNIILSAASDSIKSWTQDGIGNPIGSVSGSLNVNIPLIGNTLSLYNEITSVVSGVLTTINTYIVPVGKTFYLNKVEVSGNNLAEYSVKFNSTVNAKKYTWYGNFNEKFDYITGGNNQGYQLVTGTMVTITTIHNRSFVGSFNARIQGIEV